MQKHGVPVVNSLCKRRKADRLADRLAELLLFHCADADRKSSLKFT